MRGAYGGETQDKLVSVRAVDRKGGVHVLSNADLHYDISPLRRAGGFHLHAGDL